MASRIIAAQNTVCTLCSCSMLQHPHVHDEELQIQPSTIPLLIHWSHIESIDSNSSSGMIRAFRRSIIKLQNYMRYLAFLTKMINFITND